MNDEQRNAQIQHEINTGLHNTSPAVCSLCGKNITVGMENKCPHEQTNGY